LLRGVTGSAATAKSVGKHKTYTRVNLSPSNVWRML